MRTPVIRRLTEPEDLTAARRKELKRVINETIRIGSDTYAQKARKALSANGISSRVVKVEPARADRGCVFGLQIPGDRVAEALDILRYAGIPGTFGKDHR